MIATPPIPQELWDKTPPDAQAAVLALVQSLEKRIAALEARLGQDSSNSSKPPAPGLSVTPEQVSSSMAVNGYSSGSVRSAISRCRSPAPGRFGSSWVYSMTRARRPRASWRRSAAPG
jgi:hypothetical protein